MVSTKPRFEKHVGKRFKEKANGLVGDETQVLLFSRCERPPAVPPPPGGGGGSPEPPLGAVSSCYCSFNYGYVVILCGMYQPVVCARYAAQQLHSDLKKRYRLHFNYLRS